MPLQTVLGNIRVDKDIYGQFTHIRMHTSTTPTYEHTHKCARARTLAHTHAKLIPTRTRTYAIMTYNHVTGV